ncbi:MAG: endonuclease III [Thermodesulfovibrionales bacterium]|nr:endonuclease III [Thermodesulfovibrionales bacterium]
MEPHKKVKEIIRLLKREYPASKTALNYGSVFELLTATMLSAQTTDVHVNRVTEKLFKKYRSIGDYASAPIEALQNDIGSINFYKTKAKNIKNCAVLIMERYGSQVPKTMAELVELPGVARKTANIILSTAYGINEGIAVDTHVKRLAYRLGLSRHEDPVKIEKDLIGITPKKDWGNISHLLISHGRKTCQAKKPKHKDCVLFALCPSNSI